MKKFKVDSKVVLGVASVVLTGLTLLVDNKKSANEKNELKAEILKELTSKQD